MNSDVKSDESQLSELARGAALVRALAARDEREEIRGKDFLAELFLADESKNTLNDPAIREWLLKNYLPYGVYAYTIARTAYFDHIVEQAFRDGVPQIVILGAGYDSRPYRFANVIAETRIFELDDINLLKRKAKLLEQSGVPIPKKLSYIPLSYDITILKANLAAAGFDWGKQTLFIWEGATYYLAPEEVDKTLRFMGADIPAGSAVCFDYNTVSKDRPGADIENEFSESMGTIPSGESRQFAIEEGKEGIFLAERDFMIIENIDAEEMERRYLTLGDGTSVGKVPARHHIAYASLSK